MTETLPTFDDQPELPSPRVQTAWLIRLQQVYVARDKNTAHQHYNNGVGYLQALRDNGLVGAVDESLMAATLLRVWYETLERLDDADDAAHA